jgi:hypothetical protein
VRLPGVSGVSVRLYRMVTKLAREEPDVLLQRRKRKRRSGNKEEKEDTPRISNPLDSRRCLEALR